MQYNKNGIRFSKSIEYNDYWTLKGITEPKKPSRVKVIYSRGYKLWILNDKYIIRTKELLNGNKK